jgi:hypothetical protein
MAKTLYKQVLLLGWFVLIAFMGNAQSYEVWEGQLSGTGFAKDSVITVVDAKFGTSYYSTIQNSYKKKAVVALHTLENSALQWPASFRCEVSLQINWWDDQNVEHIEFKTLAVNYSADTLHQDTIISYYTIEGAHKIVDSILDIYVVGLSQPLPAIFALKSSLLYERDYDFDCLFPVMPISHVYKTEQHELGIFWVAQSWLANLNTNPQHNYQINYEDEIDIEWTFYDDSSELIKSGIYPCIDFAFKNNASRVSVSSKEYGYDLPLMYESGYLIYRLRQVKILPNGQRITGPWTTQTHANNPVFVYRINGHEDKLNWQAATTFAEEGKRKTVTSYFDGSSKNRQTVTKINTDSLAIVAETIYDYEGRPVVATLPSPSFDKAIQYFEKYNQNMAGQSYAWSDLDSISNGCINGPKVMSNTTGSSKYYSLNNPLKTVGHHAYVPEAFGFPFSQTQYTNDLTNRVKVSAGPGKNHHLGNVDERFTQYFYGAPTQSDLSRLFGQEVGHQSHYFKNMVMDPNGQVSITYQDMQGRTIATSLAGDLPTVDFKALDNRTDTVMLRDAIIMPGNQYIEGRSIKSTKNFLVENAALHKFIYELFPESLDIKTCDSSNFCYDCVYDLDIKLIDDCGNLVHQLVRNNYNPSNALVYYFDTTCTSETPPILDSFELVLGVGSYSVTKSLTINSQAVDYYFNDYKAKDTCIRTFEDFYIDALAEIDFSGCEVTCSSCLASLGTRQDFVNNFLNKIVSLDSPAVYTENDIAQANTAYDQLKTTCDMLCDSMNICDAKYLLMLQDMSPKGGQYATYDPSTFTSNDLASIFNQDAAFLSGITGSTVPLFKFPSLVYTNSIGIPDTIWKEDPDGELIPYLPNSLSAEEFILYWKPSWAKALVRFHPEYCNYLFCVSIDESHAYDNAMLQTTEYDSAVIKGFLNPLNQPAAPFTNSLSPDPFFASGAPGEICEADVANRLLQYVNELKPGISPPEFLTLSLWELASISASCSTATACGSCTEGYYWNTFRNIYLGLKRLCVDDAMEVAQIDCARSLNLPHTSLNFTTAPLLGKNRRFELLKDSVPVVNGGNNTINDVNDIMSETQALIDNSPNTFKCKDYASYWWGQLSSCGFNISDSATIINNLIQVCQAGTDQSHPFGASTASTSYTGTGYTSFEQVLQDAAASSSPSINFPTATCTHYLINNPMPYHVTPLYYQNVQVDKPAECVCAKIVKHKFQYMGSSHASTMSFGQYLTNVKNIIISDEDVQILLAACSQNLCNILPKPVTLPYQFECNQACANCNQVTTVYTNFLNAYPNVHLHPNYMTLMQAYMNANLGMNLTSLEYFDFMYDSCGFTNFPPADDSVQTTMQLKKAPIADPTFSMAKLLQKYATPTKTNLSSDQLLSSNHTFVNPFTKEKTVVSLRDVIDFKGNVPFTNFSSIVKTDKPKWPEQNIFNNFSPTSTQFKDTASSSSKLSWPVLGMMADFKSIISKATVNQLAKPKWPFSNLQSSITKDIIKGSNATKLPQGAFIDKLVRLNNATKAEPSTTAKFDKKVFEALRIDPSIAPGSRATDTLHHKLHINNSAYSNYISEKANYEQKRDSAITAQQRVSNFSNRSAPFTTTEKARTEMALNASNYYSPVVKSNRTNVITKVSAINLWNRLSTNHIPTQRLSKKDANLSSHPSAKEGYIYNPSDVQSLVEKLAIGQSVLDNTYLGETILNSSSTGSKGNAPAQPQFSIAPQANWCDSVAASIAIFDSLKAINTWYYGWYFTHTMYNNLGVWYDIPTWYDIIDSCQLACPSLITCAQANTVLNKFKQTYPQYASNSLSTLWVNYLNQNNGSGNGNGYNEAEWKALLNCCNIAYPAADTLGSRCDTIQMVVSNTQNPWQAVNDLNNLFGSYYHNTPQGSMYNDLNYWLTQMDSCSISCNGFVNCTQLNNVMNNFKQAYPQYANNSMSSLWVNYLNQNNASGSGYWYSENDWKAFLNCCNIAYPAADSLGSRCDTIQAVVNISGNNPWNLVNQLNNIYGSYYYYNNNNWTYKDLSYWLNQMDSCGISCNTLVNCTQLSTVINSFKQTYPQYANNSLPTLWVNYLNQNNASGNGYWYSENDWKAFLNCCNIAYPSADTLGSRCDTIQAIYSVNSNNGIWNVLNVLNNQFGYQSLGNWLNELDSCGISCNTFVNCTQLSNVMNNFKQTYPQYANNSLSTLWVNYLNQNNASGNGYWYNENDWKAFLNCCGVAYPAADTLGSRCDTIQMVVSNTQNPWQAVNDLNNLFGSSYYTNNSWMYKDLNYWLNQMDSCGISCNTLVNCTQLSTVMNNFKQAYPQYANNSMSSLWVNYLNQNNGSGNWNWYGEAEWKSFLNCCGVSYPAADTLGSRCDTIQAVVTTSGNNPWNVVNQLNNIYGSGFYDSNNNWINKELTYWLNELDSCGISCSSFINCTQLSTVMNNFKQTYPQYADSAASAFWVNYLNQNNASGTGSWYNEHDWIIQLNCCGIDYPDTMSVNYCDSLQFALDYYHSSNNFSLWNFQYFMGTTLGWGYKDSNGNWINYDYDHWFAQIDSCNLPCPQIVDCNLAQSAMDDFYQLYPAYVNQAPGFIWAQYLNYEGIGNGNWYNADQWRAILNCCGISLPQEDSISTTTCDTLLVIVNTNTALSEFPDMPTFEQIRRYYGWGEQDSTGEWQNYPMSYYFGLFDSCGISCSTLFDCAAIDSAMQQFPSLYPMYADSCPDFILENYLNGVVFEYDDGGFTFDDWTVIANCCGIEFPAIDTTPALCDSMYMMNYYIHFLDTIITQEFGQDCSPAWLVNFAIANQLGLPYELSNLCGPLDSCGYTCIDTCQLLTFCDSLQSIQTMYDLIWGSNNENGGEGNAGDGKDDDEFIDFVNTILSTNYTESEINGLLLLCDTANCEAINGFWSEIEPVLATYDSCVPPLILSTVYSVSGINLTINQWCELLSNCNIPCPDTCAVVYGNHCDSVLAAYQLFNNVAQVYNLNDSTEVLADILSMVLGYEVSPKLAWSMVQACDTSATCDSMVVFVHQYFQPLFNSYIDSCIPPYALHVLYNLLTDMDNPYLNNLDPDSWCQLYTNCGLPCPNVCQDSLNDRCDSLLVAYDLFVHIIANYEVEDTIEFLGQIVSASLGYNVSGEDAWVILSNCNCDKVLDTYESLQPLFDMYDGCVPRFVVEVAFNASMENLPYPLDYYQICRMLRACHLPCIDTCGVVQPISCDSILQFNTMYTYALELYGQYWEDTIETYNEASNFFFGYALPYEQFLAAVDSCSETYCSEQLASANSYLNNLFESYGECTPAWVVEFAYNAVLPNMGYVGINNYAEICDLMSNCNLPCPDTCGGIGPLNCDSVIAVYDLWQHVIYNLETDDSIKTLEFIQEVVLDTVLDYEDFIALVNHCDTSLCDPITLQIYDMLQPLINGYDSCVPAWVMEAVYSNALFERPYTMAEICEIWTTCGLPCPDTCVRSPFNCDTIIQIYNTVHIFYSSYCDGCQLEDTNNITQFFTQHGLGVPLNYNQLVVLYNGCIGNDEPLLCNRPLWPPLNPTVEDSCFEIMQEYAYHNAAYAYEEYLKNLHEDFVNAYTEKCLGAINLENFEFTHPNGEYHFTLYYYDQAGNLVKTVPPGGFDVTGAAEHNLFTLYRYNSLNQLIEQHTPDAGNSLFWYDRIGKMTASRNAKQDSLDQMSYTLYDDLQRIVEVGVFDTIGLNLSSYFFWDMVFNNINATWYSGISATRHAREITRTFYDEDVFNMGGKFLRNRVATSTYEDTEDFNPLTYQAASHYHYDIHGNVRKLIQDNPRLAAIGHRYKTMDYKFDLISGKVNEVIYQRGEPDQFIHQYAYDADNRITDVYTSRDSVVFSHDAFYNYYLHGPLARTTLGGNLLSGHGAVQGLDYTYTLQGWLKGLNSSALTATTDPGHDGVGIKTARDAFGFTLGYYNGDYQPAGWGSSVTAANHLEASITNLNQRSLYNGNIASMAVNVGRLNAPLAYKFGYDQLNRLATTDAFDGLDPAQNQWQNNTALTAYHNELTYDPNGNIKTNKRNGAASQEDMDDLAYFYDPNTNRLNHVTDQVAAANYAIDIDNQTANNYQYDPIGNLTKDVAEGIDTIHWNVYGKIAAIIKTNGDSLIFAYDPSGNRIMKTYWNDSLQTRKATYHVRDASGNVMATYEHTADTLRLSEWALYGSSRIGVVSPDLQLHPVLPVTTDPLLTGVNYYSLNEKQYELSNHLGNVQATISDRRVAQYDNGFSHYETEVVSAQDYYPFGMVMPERSFSK